MTSPTPVVIEVWSDIACPWCFIGKSRFARALEQFEQRDRIEVVWRSYQLSPETPVGSGEPEIDALVRAKGMPRVQVQNMFDQVRGIAEQDGLIIDFGSTITANTFDAHRLVHIARSHGKADAVLVALFAAHFTDGKQVDDTAVLLEIADAEGIDVKAALDSDEGADAVRADLAAARELGVTGVPFFVADRRIALSGAQPVEVFHQFLLESMAGEQSAGL